MELREPRGPAKGGDLDAPPRALFFFLLFFFKPRFGDSVCTDSRTLVIIVDVCKVLRPAPNPNTGVYLFVHLPGPEI